jgi:hypothetical protein
MSPIANPSNHVNLVYSRADLTASASLQPARRRHATPSQAAASPPRQPRLAYNPGAGGVRENAVFFSLLIIPAFSPSGRADLTIPASSQPVRRRFTTPSQTASLPERQSRLAHNPGAGVDETRRGSDTSCEGIPPSPKSGSRRSVLDTRTTSAPRLCVDMGGVVCCNRQPEDP